MASRTSRWYPSVKYAPPSRSDVVPVIAVALVLGLLIDALVWTWRRGESPGLGVVAGVVIGILVVAGWTLRDGLLQGEPRFELSHRISLGFLVAALSLTAAMWLLVPGSGWTGMATAGVVFFAWVLFVVIGTASVNREVESAIVTVGSGGAGRALIVYHSARGGLMRAMQEAFAEGMQAQGWQVDLSTASRLSPVDFRGYQRLVLGTPCYNRGLARPMAAYLNRVGELGGIPVVTVVTGFNYTERASMALCERVQQAHGTVVDQIELWTARPNVARDGTTDPAEIMRRAGARLARAMTGVAA